MPNKQSNVDIWLGRETPRVRRALESASRHFDPNSRLTVHTLEAIYGQESSFGILLGTRGSSGAAGHFQFKLDTAREYGLSVSKANDQRFDIDRTSSAAARYLKDLNSMFNHNTRVRGESVTVAVRNPQERYKFVLGSYSGGQRRIADAQRLAEKAGKNPRSWTDVQSFLEAANPNERMAKRNAEETRQYVEKVLAHELEFMQKSPAGKDRKAKTAKKGEYRCTEGGHWVTIDDKPVYIC